MSNLFNWRNRPIFAFPPWTCHLDGFIYQEAKFEAYDCSIKFLKEEITQSSEILTFEIDFVWFVKIEEAFVNEITDKVFIFVSNYLLKAFFISYVNEL